MDMGAFFELLPDFLKSASPAALVGATIASLLAIITLKSLKEEVKNIAKVCKSNNDNIIALEKNQEIMQYELSQMSKKLDTLVKYDERSSEERKEIQISLASFQANIETRLQQVEKIVL